MGDVEARLAMNAWPIPAGQADGYLWMLDFLQRCDMPDGPKAQVRAILMMHWSANVPKPKTILATRIRVLLKGLWTTIKPSSRSTAGGCRGSRRPCT